MVNSYKIEYYFNEFKYSEEFTSEFKSKIDEELSYLEIIKKQYDVKIRRIFSDLSFLKNPDYNEEYEELYLNKIAMAANHSRVKISKLFKTNSGNNKIDNFILIYRDASPIAVYPHIVEENEKSVIDGLKQIVELGFEKKKVQEDIEEISEEYKFTESDLQKLVATNPNLIEDGLILKGIEVPVKNGLIDLVFMDENDVFLICELKLDFTDQLIGQILRYANTFLDEFNAEKIRKAIITLERSEERIKACENAGIEVYILNMEKF
jgi:hypothetical protein